MKPLYDTLLNNATKALINAAAGMNNAAVAVANADTENNKAMYTEQYWKHLGTIVTVKQLLTDSGIPVEMTNGTTKIAKLGGNIFQTFASVTVNGEKYSL